MDDKIKIIGKKSEKIGDTIVTGEGTGVQVVNKPESVAVRDYVAGKGYSGIVDWDGENAVVAGVKLKPDKVKNGIAFVNKDDVDSVISRMENDAGIKNPEKSRAEKYGAMEDNALKAVANRKPFSYDVEDDVVYQSYKKQYEREAEYALRRILNDNNTSVEGATGAVLSEAMSAYDSKLDKITDVIPELYEAAYKRYTDDGDTLNSNLKTISSVANDYYDRVLQNNKDKTESIVSAGEKEREERQRQIENERNAEKDFYENALNDIEIMYKNDKMRSDITKSNTAAEKTAMGNALTRGFFIESDEDLMPWLKNFRIGNGRYSISPSLANIAYEYESAHARERAKINAKLGL